ncbi:MAG: hypothetical protein M3Y67_01830, partial [Pseudomonadota bacterium]|nr:hypothetical protein [Pseudomonadota bacterium]
MLPRCTAVASLIALFAAISLVVVSPAVRAQGSALQAFAGSGTAPAPPWHVVGLPQQTKPYTQFTVVDIDGKRALRIEADKSY